MKIQCGKCNKAFRVKLMTLSDQAKCPHCKHVVLFSDVRVVRKTNKIFWFGVLIVAFLSIYWIAPSFSLPEWLVAVAVILLSMVIFAPVNRLIMCLLYNKFHTK